ncbi:glycosyltransferase [uncultured Paracoccus sp.]|uniref:glycosyltransferase n=1 Tax=uncultured Paracoccus sp. TaxID=189685 RepID=UPI002623E41C|nr:glycosyltransferase [uncultured Paracoccus sp.]
MPDQPPVTILLAVYNGGLHLSEQLDSFAAQERGDWRLIISDDGSTDDSRAICAGFQTRYGAERVRLIDGPGGGATRNFLHLIEAAPAGVPLAFSDQDDVWLPQKMARAAAHLAGREGPALYCARTMICDANLQNRTPSRHFTRPHGFRNALVQACTPGNSSVFTPAAAALLKCSAVAAIQNRVEAHDWWAYQVVSGAGGEVIFDPEPSLLYRQHASNVMGRNDTASGRWRRLTMLMQGDFGSWLAANVDALAAVPDLLTPENSRVLAGFNRMLTLSGPLALREISRLGLYRQTGSGDVALRLAAVTGRLRRPD